MDTVFVLNSILLGAGLAMDAFSVSIANAVYEPGMRPGKMCAAAGVYAGFQFVMPLIGWLCVHTVIEFFAPFADIVPWIALCLLCFIGGKMLYEGLHGEKDEKQVRNLRTGTLLLQGIATSIDALSVGFTIAGYDVISAFTASLIIAVVTFVICMAGFRIGRTIGNRWTGKAPVIGGCILIFIGIEIAITHFI